MTPPAAECPPRGPHPFVREGGCGRGLCPRAAPSRRVGVLAALVLLAAGGVARAEEVPADGVVVQVPPAITTEATNRLRSLLHGPLKRFEAGAGRRGGVFHVVLDFNPDNKRSECEDFGACYGLAKYLRSLPTEHRGVQTVGFVRADVRRHSVLPLLACGEIVLSSRPEARFGQVVPAGRSLPKAERTAYEDLARGRYPLVLVRKMYEADLEVIKVGDQYVDAASKARGNPVAELARGETALYTFALAKRLGLCKQRSHDTLDEMVVEYQVPRGGLNRALDRTVCWRIPVKGTVNGELKEQLKRRIERALRQRATLLILELE